MVSYPAVIKVFNDGKSRTPENPFRMTFRVRKKIEYLIDRMGYDCPGFVFFQGTAGLLNAFIPEY
ncbi:MAG: hypothetical protein AMS23_05615 [Bacteroides sp. SM1_62]|nr:MAG: hypothetical protein AMS26_01975 [Bacteroides sp. SM23_62]KPL24510.1 MAG: hypothetical protein AMS23_05615 [Bacteroides sp. SM1_62]